MFSAITSSDIPNKLKEVVMETDHSLAFSVFTEDSLICFWIVGTGIFCLCILLVTFPQSLVTKTAFNQFVDRVRMFSVWCVSVLSLRGHRALPLLVDHNPFADQVRDLYGEPRSESQSHKMCQAKTWDVAGPQRCEVLGQADLPTPVHLCGLSVKFGNRNLGCGVRVSHGNIKLYLELVAQQLVDKPTSAGPSCAVWVRLQAEPVVVRRLVLLYEANQRLVLLLQSLGPQRPVPRPRVRLQQRYLRNCLSRGFVCHADPAINERSV